ncbi:hypothetical protein [Siccirubricoccus phaeus]|uniref:hypothetical protein n=1 Tax=Siccirubricoccus phaeus TaxID=2595053 RepID=UPI0011F1F53C|nr:hypothetical protein [Siccirubricoccus phaeus]
MSSRNDGTSEAAMGFALLAAFAFFFFMLIFALATFAAFVFTCLALLAWNEPLKLGKETLQPDEARRFVYGGLGGAVALPFFVLFCILLFGVPIREDAWVYIVIAGYDLGSIGLAMIEAAEAEEAKKAALLNPPPPPAPPAPEPKPARRTQNPFEYADWDDEDARQ